MGYYDREDDNYDETDLCEDCGLYYCECGWDDDNDYFYCPTCQRDLEDCECEG